jgi:hypothetical protein
MLEFQFTRPAWGDGYCNTFPCNKEGE